MKPRTTTVRQTSSAVIDVPPLSLRADVGTFNEEARTVELIFSTGAAVERMDWSSGQRYLEKLSLDPAHIRLDRLNAGAPLLDSHSAWSVTDQLGAVVPGSARVEKGNAIATVKFSGREAVAPILQDVRDGIIRSVSVGYRVHKFEEATAKGNKLPIRTAVDWEPFEISMVTMPADTGAKVRRDQVETNRCVLTRQEKPMSKEQTTRDPQAETIDERAGLLPDPDGPPEETPREPTERERGIEAERKRISGLSNAGRIARVGYDFIKRLIDEGVSLEEGQTRILEEMEARQDPQKAPNGGARRVEFTNDPLIHVRAGIENALLHRINPQHFKLEDKGREYRGMTLLDVAKAYVQGRGIRITGMSKMELAGVALGLTQIRGGMHSTSDFPLLLADVANKSLRAEYLAAPQTFQPLTRPVSLSDFKPANRVQIGDAPALLPINQHGEFTRGSIGEGREQIQLATYGRVFAITRKALVNDDVDAFSRVPAKFGRAARNLESDLVWYQILSNPQMGDGNNLFVAGHGNIDSSGDPISIVSIGIAETAMLLQTGLDGATLIMAQPKYLIVPPSQKVKALQFVSTNMQAAQASDVNPYAGRLEVICEPRLETGITLGSASAAGSSIAWYLAADPSQVDILELAMLDGQDGPLVESRVGFDVDGLEIKCRHDVGAKVIDWRGLYLNAGDIDS